MNQSKKGVPLSCEHRKKLSETRKKLFKESKLKLSEKQLKGLEFGRIKRFFNDCKQCKINFHNPTHQKFCSKKCEGVFNRGSNNPNWKGGKFLEKRPRESIEYKIWRKLVFEKDNYTCQVCLQKGGKLIAHHIKSWKYYPELRFDLNNGQTLCIKDHTKTHNYGIKNFWNKGMM